jgi:putative transposase
VGEHVDHVHILCKLSKKIALVKLIEEVKSRSSKWMKTKGGEYSDFYWQDGYGAFSVNPSHVDTVIE